MKRWIILLALLLCVGCMTACTAKSPLEHAASRVGLDLSAGSVSASVETHGGFHNDGMTYTVLTFPDDALFAAIAENTAWQPLPLPQTVSKLLYGCRTERSVTGAYLVDENGDALFPTVQNGAYHFLDRHSDSAAGAADPALLERNSFNFTVALYDADTNTLYFGELDT